MKGTSSTKFQKSTLVQNVEIKIPDINWAKMDPRSIIAVITDFKDEGFYEFSTKLWILKRCTEETNLPYGKKIF